MKKERTMERNAGRLKDQFSIDGDIREGERGE